MQTEHRRPQREISSPGSGDETGTVLRYAQALLFVGVWAGIGYAFELDPNAYLLIGVPLTFAFQIGIRRRPIRQLWVRDGAAFRLNRVGILIALALLVMPVENLAVSIYRHQWAPAAWDLAAAAGAFAAAYALTRFTRETTRHFFLCLAIAGGIGTTIMGGAALARAFALHEGVHVRIGVGLRSVLLYFPVTFLLEEVAFRGLIDAHVHPSSGRRGRWTSALFVSALWGLWHWPVVPHVGVPFWATAVQLIGIHSVVGVPLSMFWRKTGNLAVPGFTHAFIDAIRNALLSH